MKNDFEVRSGLELLEFHSFEPRTLVVESQALRNNPLGDPSLRRNPVLVPKSAPPPGGFPVVLQLSGLFGNGTYSFNLKNRDPSVAQTLDQQLARGEAPAAVYVFCDAMTAWGGSQFLNSEGTGRYEDYVVKELVAAVKEAFDVSDDPQKWCVSGGSSGGYGALHLGSRYPKLFEKIVAIAPDSFFEASLMPDLYTAATTLKALGVAGARAELESGRLKKRKDWHAVANAVAMGLCYAPDGNGGIEFPLDFETGLIRPEVWTKWKAHDPTVFLKERLPAGLKTTLVYLDVGVKDQFQLQFGTRQVRDILQAAGVSCVYTEFEGNHFDIGERRPWAWRWLKGQWG